MNYEEIICDANNLYRAYKVSVKTSKWKETTQKFMLNFLRYIFSIQDDLMNRTLQNGPTQEFTLFERGNQTNQPKAGYYDAQKAQETRRQSEKRGDNV